jgi:2'-5' RNA ligase
MARVFSAIDITSSELLDELEHVQEKLNLGFTPVRPEKMHITLQFFEDIDDEQIEKVKRGLEGIDVEPFSAQIKGVGAFPSEDYIRVLWAGAENHQIREVYSQARNHGVKSSDNNQFTPHVTLLRVKNISQSKKVRLKKSVNEFKDHYFGELNADSVKLFESHLGPNGSQYKELYVKKL